MQRKYIIMLLILSAWMSQIALAQQTTAKKDSAKVYRNIEEFSKKGKVTKFIYDLFFMPVSSIPAQTRKTSKKQPNKPKHNRNFEGKIIRHIYITTLDPFGYSVSDTAIAPLKFIYKAGNSLHIRTRQITIRNLLLIRKNKPFDSLLVKESERLIRAQPYVHEVSVTVRSTRNKSDSVDISIRVLDTWSIIANGEISSSNSSIALEDKNFGGLGHDFQNNFSLNNTNGKNAFKTNYLIPNIRSAYISTTLHYENDENNNFSKSFTIDRPFFSPFAKWAAGINLGQQFRKGLIKTADSLFLPQNFKLNTQDYWAGYAHRILKGNTENARTTNLIVAGHFTRVHYIESPPAMYDTLHQYATEDFYLTTIGISTRKYVQDTYIFNYGRTEDVPVGMVYSLTGGYKAKNNSGKLYLGMRASFGNYNKWGYLSTNVEYGTFLRSANFEQGVFSAGFNYFTELFEIGGLKLRQFIKSQYVLGINRLPGESLNINNENGIRGFDSPSIVGTQKILLTFQTQLYLPWRVLAFRFGPYLVYSLGMLGNEASGFQKSSVYSQIGVGLLIKNEFMVFNTFQISIAFYPTIPGMGDNVFKKDPDKASDFGFRDFDIGKPSAVAYR